MANCASLLVGISLPDALLIRIRACFLERCFFCSQTCLPPFNLTAEFIQRKNRFDHMLFLKIALITCFFLARLWRL